MKADIKSSDVPDVSGLVKREIAYNKRVNPIEEMRYRINKYDSSNSEFNLRVVDNDSNIKIRFTSSSGKGSSKIEKELVDANVHNSAFGKFNYDLELLSVSLKNNRQQVDEYLELVYWGSVKDNNVQDFVEQNARIVKQDVPLDDKTRKQVNTRFLCTDVNAYTENRAPNPWCRDCLLLVYENEDMFNKLRDHSELGVSKKNFSKVYNDNVLDPSELM